MSLAAKRLRKRDQEPESLLEPESASPLADDDIFNLSASSPLEDGESEAPEVTPQPPRPDTAAGRAVHTIGITDLTRLSIDNDGRLYWDGKPVEVQRRILLSRRQVIAASVIGALVAIGALAATVHASAAAMDWACRMGWSTNYCPPQPPEALPPPDIPA